MPAFFWVSELRIYLTFRLSVLPPSSLCLSWLVCILQPYGRRPYAGCTERYEANCPIAATEDGRKGHNCPYLMTVQYFQEDSSFFGLQQWDVWN